MGRPILCRACGNYHDSGEQWPIDCSEHHALASMAGDHLGRRNSGSLPMPFIACDTMDAVQSQATGKMYDSKSALRAEYKRLGMVEVGNDPARHKPHVKPKPSKKEIRETIAKATARVERGERSKNSRHVN